MDSGDKGHNKGIRRWLKIYLCPLSPYPQSYTQFGDIVWMGGDKREYKTSLWSEVI